MNFPLYQVDAFTDRIFGGNPAAVCILRDWLPADTMQKIAMENNLSETAFLVKKDENFEIRWFTPLVEVDLCGHATLATSHIIFTVLEPERNKIEFFSRSGTLIVTKDEEGITLNFPADIMKPAQAPELLLESLNISPPEIFKGKTDYMLIVESQGIIENLSPDFGMMKRSGGRGVIVTSRGDEVDFVSRFFAPQVGVDEDPVTGSAHTSLIPYWAHRLGKNEMTALQLSKRKGSLKCRFLGDRVEITGNAVTYLTGQIMI